MTSFTPYRNQSTDLQTNSINWFLYDRNIGRQKVVDFAQILEIYNVFVVVFEQVSTC